MVFIDAPAASIGLASAAVVAAAADGVPWGGGASEPVAATNGAPSLTIGAPAVPIGLAPSPPAAAADGDAWDGRASEPVAAVAGSVAA